LEKNLKVVQENRRELIEEVVPREVPNAVAQEAKQEYREEDGEMYNFDDDTFLDNIE